MELSSGFITSGMENGYTQRIISGYDGGTPARCGLIGPGASSAYGMMFILKGSVPTNFGGLTSWGVRSSDVLLQFTKAAGEIFLNFPGNNTVNFNTIYKNASASGTATWFWIMTTRGSGSSGETIFQQMIGTVGTQGSGADMEISSTTVTSGQPYRVIQSTITLPTSWTL